MLDGTSWGRSIARGRAALAEQLRPPEVPDEEQARAYARAIGLLALVALAGYAPVMLLDPPPGGVTVREAAVTFAGGLAMALSFFVPPRHSRLAAVLAVANVFVLGLIATFGPHHVLQVSLAFALLISAHAAVHGLGAALAAVVPASIVQPTVALQGASPRPGDFIYAGIFLFGCALLPWVGSRLAERRADALRRQLGLVRRAERESVLLLGRAAEAKDEDTGEHVGQVGELSERLAMAVGLPPDEAEGLRFAAMLHDVGKIHVPDRILLKPGPLTRGEWEIMRRHTIWGEEILGRSPAFHEARLVARSHHEDWDGCGYPDRLKGADIPLAARIVRLVDVFDALIRDRPYKRAWSLARALTEIEQQAGRQFDPELTRLFLSLVDRSAEEPVDLARVRAVRRAG